MRLQYPSNVRVIMMPCTGRVDVIHLLKAIEDGADGVYVAGCLEGDCHYLTGNLKARKRVEAVKKILGESRPRRGPGGHVQPFGRPGTPLRRDRPGDDRKDQGPWPQPHQAGGQGGLIRG